MKVKGTVKENKDIVIKLADEGVLSLEEIGALFDPPVTRKKRTRRAIKSKVAISREELARLYHVENRGPKYIAKVYGVSKALINKRMREYGIPRRSLSDAGMLAKGNTRKVHSIPRPIRGPWKYIMYKNAHYPLGKTEIKGRVRIEVVGNRLRAFGSEDGMLVKEWKLKKGRGRYKKGN